MQYHSNITNQTPPNQAELETLLSSLINRFDLSHNVICKLHFKSKLPLSSLGGAE